MDGKSNVTQLKAGDKVYPSPSNPLKFKEWVTFPWLVYRVKNTQVVLMRPRKDGTTYKDIWFIGFWTKEAPA